MVKSEHCLEYMWTGITRMAPLVTIPTMLRPENAFKSNECATLIGGGSITQRLMLQLKP